MALPAAPVARLITGMRLSPEAFLDTLEGIPDLKHAELIDGVVYVASPISVEHGRPQHLIAGLFFNYAVRTGAEAGQDVTWAMLGSIPQPDVFLRKRTGGLSRVGKKYFEGAPELAVEICVTSTEYDFGPKLALYQRAGVEEYITVETLTSTITWRRLTEAGYVALPSPEDGIYRSFAFPGLWFDTAAFWAEDGAGMLAALEQGLAAS